MSATAAAVIISRPQANTPSVCGLVEDEFIGLADLNTVRTEVFHNIARKVLFETKEYVQENRWEDILALFYPVDTKLPDLVANYVRIPRSRPVWRKWTWFRNTDCPNCLPPMWRWCVGNGIF